MGIAIPEAIHFGEPLWLTRNKTSGNLVRGSAAQVAAEGKQGRIMFRGNHPAKIEENGRLKLPVPFKQLLDAASSDRPVRDQRGRQASPDLAAWRMGKD